MYLPLYVGAKGNLNIGYQRDDDGINISELNPYFSELSGLYWGWKNLCDDYIGLAHYRRHFELHRNLADVWRGVLTDSDIKPYLGKIKIFIPTKRKYYIETLYSHYAHTHFASELDMTRAIVAEKYPEYLRNFDKVMKRSWGYMFNMLIARRDCLNEYCEWLFDILFELKRQSDGKRERQLSEFQRR